MSKYKLANQGNWNEKHNISADFRVKHYRMLIKTVEKFEEFTNQSIHNVILIYITDGTICFEFAEILITMMIMIVFCVTFLQSELSCYLLY